MYALRLSNAVCVISGVVNETMADDLPDGMSELLTHNALRFAEEIGNPTIIDQNKLKGLRQRYQNRVAKRKRPPPPPSATDPPRLEELPDAPPQDAAEGPPPPPPLPLEPPTNHLPPPVLPPPSPPRARTPSPEAPAHTPAPENVAEKSPERPMLTEAQRQMELQREAMRARWQEDRNAEDAAGIGGAIMRRNEDAVKAATIAGLDALLFSVPEVLRDDAGQKKYSEKDSMEYLQDLRLKAQTYHAEQRKFKELQTKFNLGTKVVSTLASKVASVDGLEQHIQNDMPMFLPALQRMAAEQSLGERTLTPGQELQNAILLSSASFLINKWQGRGPLANAPPPRMGNFPAFGAPVQQQAMPAANAQELKAHPSADTEAVNLVF